MTIEIAVEKTTEEEEECLKERQERWILSLLLCFPAWFRPSFLPSLRSGGKLRRVLHVKDERGAAARKGTKKRRKTKCNTLAGETVSEDRTGREGTVGIGVPLHVGGTTLDAR